MLVLAGRKKGVQGAKCQDNAQESAQEKFKTGVRVSADVFTFLCKNVNRLSRHRQDYVLRGCKLVASFGYKRTLPHPVHCLLTTPSIPFARPARRTSEVRLGLFALLRPTFLAS